jgi:hypothetical protein
MDELLQQRVHPIRGTRCHGVSSRRHIAILGRGMYLLPCGVTIHSNSNALQQFDEILKYCNDLSMTIELDTTLAQAEVLFLSFAQLAADIDRREAEAKSQSGLRQRKATLGVTSEEQAQSTAIATPKPPQLSEELRRLLL